MRWAPASSTLEDTAAAASAAAGSVRAALGDGPVDLVIAFFTSTHVPSAEALSEALKRSLAPGCLIGCSSRGVVSTRHELESDPALSVIAARLPGVELHPFVLVNAGWSAAAERREEFERHAPHSIGAELVLLV